MQEALIVVDMQKDFMPKGALATPEADTIIHLINQLMDQFPIVLATKDWHPKGHVSFAASHPEKKVGDRIRVGNIEQILWPVHCVQDTEGAEFAKGLHTEKIKEIFYKGTDPEIDSYSTFFDNAHLRKTGLEQYLKKHGIDKIAFVGFATEYCVLYSTLDAITLGFEVTVIRDGCRAINLQPDDETKALEKMKEKGANIVLAKEIL